MASMGEAIEEGAGESFGAEDLGPLLEGQVGGEHDAVVLVGPADDLEEQLGGGFGERDISHLVEEQQIDALKLLVQALQFSLFAALHELGDQVGGGVEADLSPLGAGGEGQRS
jgi:hypothetical protein